MHHLAASLVYQASKMEFRVACIAAEPGIRPEPTENNWILAGAYQIWWAPDTSNNLDCEQSSNNQRLGSAGDNDRRSKGSWSVAPTPCFAYFSLDRCSKHARIRRRGVEGRNARDQIAFCARGILNECWLCTCDACVIYNNPEITIAGSCCCLQ